AGRPRVGKGSQLPGGGPSAVEPVRAPPRPTGCAAAKSRGGRSGRQEPRRLKRPTSAACAQETTPSKSEKLSELARSLRPASSAPSTPGVGQSGPPGCPYPGGPALFRAGLLFNGLACPACALPRPCASLSPPSVCGPAI